MRSRGRPYDRFVDVLAVATALFAGVAVGVAVGMGLVARFGRR